MKRFAQLQSTLLSARSRGFTVLVCILIGLSGCAARRAKPRVFPWGIASQAHPVPSESSAAGAESATELPAAEISAALLAQITPPPSPLIAINVSPTRPRVPSGSPVIKESPSEPDVPQIAPQLSPAETAAAQQQTNQSLDVAGRNLQATAGRKLNGTQLDLASKVRSFIAEARDAAQTGDWTRARNAAKKAEVLSQELASSL